MSNFYPAQVYADSDCTVRTVIPEEYRKPMAELVDAFLYIAPRDLALNEPMPADIALDEEYMAEMMRRAALQGYPGASSWTPTSVKEQIVKSAGNPHYGVARSPDPKVVAQDCLARKKASGPAK